jgi:large subunit ribosomal protein L4
VVVESLSVPDGKTRSMAKIAANLGVTAKKSVLLVGAKNQQQDLLLRATRNLPKIWVLPVEGANVYDVMRCPYLVATRESITALEQRVLKALEA